MNLTQILLVLVILGLIAYDVIAGKLGQPTESAVLRDWARDWTILPFTAGFLLGHWFGPHVHADVSGWMWALPIMGVLLGIDVYWNVIRPQKIRLVAPPPWWRYSLWYALAGIPVGMLLWPQPGSWSPIS